MKDAATQDGRNVSYNPNYKMFNPKAAEQEAEMATVNTPDKPQPNANNPNFDPTGSPTGGQTLDQVKMNNAMTTAGNAKNAFLEQPKTPSAQSVTQSNTNTPQQAPTPQKDVAANNTTPTPVKTPPVHVPTPSTAPSVASQVGNQLKNTAIFMGVNGAVRKAVSSVNSQSKPKPTNNGYGQGKHGQYMG